MHRGVYTAASGMAAAEKWMDTIAGNLANASTVGFKREGIDFNEQLLRVLHNSAGKAVGDLGGGPAEIDRHIIFDVGTPLNTGNPLDVAIRTTEGMFAVQTPEGIRYTRNGSFSLNANGLLATKDGFPVLDAQGQTIQLTPGLAEITPDGVVLAQGQRVGQLGLFQGKFERHGFNLYTAPDAQPIPNINLATSAVESSNVNAIEEMVSMVKLNRAFELAQKSVTSQDEASGTLLSILQQ